MSEVARACLRWIATPQAARKSREEKHILEVACFVVWEVWMSLTANNRIHCRHCCTCHMSAACHVAHHHSLKSWEEWRESYMSVSCLSQRAWPYHMSSRLHKYHIEVHVMVFSGEKFLFFLSKCETVLHAMPRQFCLISEECSLPKKFWEFYQKTVEVHPLPHCCLTSRLNGLLV